MHHNSFGTYQTCVTVNGRSFLGLGHTPAEAHRNAWDAVGERYQDWSGVGAVMRSGPVMAERVGSVRSLV